MDYNYNTRMKVLHLFRIIPFMLSYFRIACSLDQTGNFEIRLANGTVPWEGRVEIYINGNWGTVCASRLWGLEQASFFCRLLDFDSAASALRDPIFGPGIPPGKMDEPLVVVDQLKCKDYLTSSFDYCDKQYFPKDCKASGAAVRCLKQSYDDKDISYSIRLVDGTSPYEGRVEINVNGIWGSICSRKWDKPLNGTPLNGQVVCKQLGFGPSINTASVSFGNGEGPVFVSNVNCNGRERTILDCRHVEVNMEECEGDNRDDVGVRCSNPADEYPVRLRSFKGSTSLQGIVEIHANDRWGSICTPPSKWTDDNSRVVCRNLGLGPPVDRPVLPQDGGEDWPVPYSYSSPLLKEIDCVGTESQLALCSHSLWMQHNSTGYGCKRREIVTISCEEPATKDYTIRLYNASSSYNGHLEIFFENEWGVICSNGEWDWKDAKVACHQLGLGTPGRVYTTELTRRMSRPVVARMRCTGEETTLNQCRHSGFGRRTCNDKAIAALTCTKPPEATTGQRPIPIRLVGGIDEREGRLEILYNSTWGRVCDTDWGIEEGNVVCQQLGYGPAEEVPSGEGLYSESESDKAPRIWLDQVECLGHEAMVATCSHSRWGETFCGANQEAGVRCTGTASSLSICWTLILTLCVTARMILNITT